MNPRTVRLAAVLFWGTMTLALVTRSVWAPAALLERFRPANLALGAWLAFGLTLYNVVRLFLTRRATGGSGPTFRERLASRRDAQRRSAASDGPEGGGTPEYIAELDFTRPGDRPA